ncbi:TPA: EAL domain-containing protein [Citrobacter gillenii]|uniref:EAL domain-containing protein n=1 Tax=Citrobacter freundii TaxID=546 RepID=UPI0015E9E368|nr:EAL domain-containing protein [Citrobacter freundii]QLY61017.1 EAL domain-containing protein [Citrobacter freundii]
MMSTLINCAAHRWLTDIEHFRLEPLIDLVSNRIVGYEVLSKLRYERNPEKWFANVSGRQQVELLLQQVERVTDSIVDRCFYNLSTDGFMCLSQLDIDCIATFNSICIEISDASAFKSLDDKTRYLFFKKLRNLRSYGVKIWVDDFTFADLVSLPEYNGNVDGIKIDKSEINSPVLKNIIHSVKTVMGDIPVLIEGVASENELITGIQSGADIAQGYFWKEENLIAN